MIKTEQEYQALKSRLVDEAALLEQQKAAFSAGGLTGETLLLAMEPLESFYRQLEDEVRFYERIKEGDFTALERFESLGRLLIALRIYRGWSQSELARRLGVSRSMVCKDERDEYHGASKEKLNRIARMLGFRLTQKAMPISEAEAATDADLLEGVGLT